MPNSAVIVPMKNEQNASESLGNTSLNSPHKDLKQCINSLKFCFTFNNYTEKDKKCLSFVFNKICKKWIYGEEVGESGTRHLQGWVFFKKKTRPIQCKDLKEFRGKIHWEKQKARNYMDAIQYCWKGNETDTATDVPATDFIGDYGGMLLPQKLNIPDYKDLYDWELLILDLIKGKPHSRNIYWFYDRKCGAGKTTFCKYLIEHHNAIILGSNANNMKHGIMSFKEKHNVTPELIVMNFTKTQDKVSYIGIEECKDMCFFSGKYESNMICGNCPHLIIFANEKPPDIDKLALDRWKIYNMNRKRWLRIEEMVSDSDDESDEETDYDADL